MRIQRKKKAKKLRTSIMSKNIQFEAALQSIFKRNNNNNNKYNDRQHFLFLFFYSLCVVLTIRKIKYELEAKKKEENLYLRKFKVQNVSATDWCDQRVACRASNAHARRIFFYFFSSVGAMNFTTFYSFRFFFFFSFFFCFILRTIL